MNYLAMIPLGAVLGAIIYFLVLWRKDNRSGAKGEVLRDVKAIEDEKEKEAQAKREEVREEFNNLRDHYPNDWDSIHRLPEKPPSEGEP